MKRMLQQHKKSIIAVVIIVFIVAGLLDLKYEGLFYQLLPNAVQSYVSTIF